MVDVKLEKILDGVYLAYFGSQKEMNSTLLRFQEYYENPRFSGKIFTVDQYKDWYKKHSDRGKRTGRFTYYTDIAGCNFPTEILEPFKNGDFDPLSKKEKEFLKRLTRIDDLCYLIGVYNKDKGEALTHEIAHGLWHVDPEYRNRAKKVIRSLDERTRREFDRFLKRNLYHPRVQLDELHAYLGEDLNYLEQEGIPVKGVERQHRKIKDIFKEHSGRNR